MATGLFDDLVPSGAAAPAAAGEAMLSTGLFDDLLPKPRGALSEAGRAVARGAIGGAGQMIGGPAALFPELPGAETGESVTGYANKRFAPSPGRESEFLTNELPSFVGGIAPGAAGMAAATALGGPVAGLGIGAAAFGAQGAGGAAEEAKAAGATPEQQRIAAAAGGTTNAALALVPGGQLTRGAARILPRLAEPGLVGSLARTGAAATEGAALGAGGQLIGNEVAQQTYDPDRPLMQGVPQAAAVTGAGMGLLHPIIGAGAPRSGEAPPPARAPETDPTRLLSPPAIPMGDESALRGQYEASVARWREQEAAAGDKYAPNRAGPETFEGWKARLGYGENATLPALSPPSPRNATNRAFIEGQNAAVGGTLGPNTGRDPNQFIIPDQRAAPAGAPHPLDLVSKYENRSGDPLLGWGNTDLSRYPLSDTGFPEWPGKPGPKGNSTAAGLWQITRSTWDPIARRLGITDFSPESQRAVAEELYRTRGLQPWAPNNSALAAAIARGETAGPVTIGRGGVRSGAEGGDLAALPGPAPMLALPRPETTYGDNFTMRSAREEAGLPPQLALPKPDTIYGEGFTAGAPPPNSTPLERVMYALRRLDPGEPVTTRRLSDYSGLTSQDQIRNLRASLVRRGLILSENGRYTRASHLNEPEVLAPTAPQATTVAQTAPDTRQPLAPIVPGRVPMPAAPQLSNVADFAQPIKASQAITSTGRQMPVDYAIADLDKLVTSHSNDLAANPDYPQQLQPRDRGRVATEMQIHDLLNPEKFRPELLGETPDASTGAPIVGPDRVVESGNARTIALRRAYEQGLPAADTYRSFLESQGYPIEGIEKPALVRINRADWANPGDREMATREMNAPMLAAMSSTEKAVSDARALPNAVLDLHRPGDLTSAANRQFVRRALESVAGPNELGALVDANGNLSGEGMRRVQGAMLAKAYGDPHLLSQMIESTDSNIKAIGNGLIEAAPAWAKMRAGVADGSVLPEVDITPHLVEAVTLISRARSEGRDITEFTQQRDMLGGGIRPETEEILKWLLGPNFTKRVGQAKIADAARWYAEEAAKAQPGPNLFGETAATRPLDIIGAARARAQEDQTGNLFGAPVGEPGGTGDLRQGAAPRGAAEQRPGSGAAGAGEPGGGTGAGIDRSALRSELYRTIKEVAPSLRLRTFDDLIGNIEGQPSPIYGAYHTEARPGGLMEHIASIALHGPDPAGALNHEIVHFLRRSGMFTAPEWSALSRKAEDWAKQFGIRERYRDLSPGARREEAIAEAYAAFNRGEPTPPGFRRIFNKVGQFFERIGNWLRGNGYQSAEDVFRRTQGGEVGRRGEPQLATEPRAPERDVSMEQQPLTDEDIARFGEPWPGWSQGAPMPTRAADAAGNPIERAPPGETLHQRPPADPRVDDALKAIRVSPDDRPLWQRALDMMKTAATRARDEGRYAAIDSFDPILSLDKSFNQSKSREAKRLDASTSAFVAAHLSRELPTIMGQVVGVPDGQGGFHGGVPKLDRGGYITNPESAPLSAAFKPVFDAGRQDAFELWWAINRGKRLMSEGRERLITPEMIAEHRNDDRRPENLGPNGENLFRQAQQDWIKFNKDVLDFGAQTGIVNAEQRAMWERGDYVPFFRSIGEENPIGPGRGARGIANQSSGIKQLTGGTEKLNSLYENAYLVSEAMIARGLKNEAARRTRDEALPLGAMEKVSLAEQMASKGKRGDNIVSVMDGGKHEYYRVTSPLLYKAIASFGPVEAGAITKALGLPKKLLTTMVTHEPTFMAANLMRDTIHSWVVTGSDFKPGLDTAKGAMSSLRNSPEAMAIMAGGGGGPHFYGKNAAGFVKSLDGTWTPLKSVRNVWDQLERVGSASEMANRIAIYEAALKRGASHAEAVWQAKDLLNFTASGGSELMKFLIQTVPFMNARIQGLDRLQRGARENPASFLTRGALVTAASLGLWALNKDNPEYQQLPDYEKQAYWHLFMPGFTLRIPKPFEVGAIFGSIPEMLGDFIDNGNHHQLWNAFVTNLTQQLNMSPIPQALSPAFDVARNVNNLSGAPIVSESEHNLVPGERFGPQTGATMKAIGQQLNLSPDQLEYLFKGYGGTLGSYLLASSDALTNAASGKTRPDTRVEQYPLVGRFIRTEPALANRWINGFYDVKTEVDQLHATMNAMVKAGRGAEAQALAQDNLDKLGLRGGTQTIGHQLTAIRQAMKQVQDSPNLTSAEMRTRLDDLVRMRNVVGEAARPLIERARP